MLTKIQAGELVADTSSSFLRFRLNTNAYRRCLQCTTTRPASTALVQCYAKVSEMIVLIVSVSAALKVCRVRQMTQDDQSAATAGRVRPLSHQYSIWPIPVSN